MILFHASWQDAKNDTLIETWARETLKAVEKRGREEEIFYPFVFLNDAAPWQKPFETYGEGKSLAKLREVSKKYDP